MKRNYGVLKKRLLNELGLSFIQYATFLAKKVTY